MKLESASPPAPRVLHFSLLHTCCPTESQSWIRSGPLCMWNFCGWRRRPRPGHNKLLTKHNLCYRMGACDITSSPGAVWDLGQTQAFCVCPEPEHPVHASWIILPCHLYCLRVWTHPDILTQWGSVGQTFPTCHGSEIHLKRGGERKEERNCPESYELNKFIQVLTTILTGNLEKLLLNYHINISVVKLKTFQIMPKKTLLI